VESRFFSALPHPHPPPAPLRDFFETHFLFPCPTGTRGRTSPDFPSFFLLDSSTTILERPLPGFFPSLCELVKLPLSPRKTRGGADPASRGFGSSDLRSCLPVFLLVFGVHMPSADSFLGEAPSLAPVTRLSAPLCSLPERCRQAQFHERGFVPFRRVFPHGWLHLRKLRFPPTHAASSHRPLVTSIFGMDTPAASDRRTHSCRILGLPPPSRVEDLLLVLFNEAVCHLVCAFDPLRVLLGTKLFYLRSDLDSAVRTAVFPSGFPLPAVAG